MKFCKYTAFLTGTLLLVGCGGGSSSRSTTSPDDSTNNTKTGISISGTITYDKVPVNSDLVGLDYSHITHEKVKDAIVELVNASGTTIDTTTTDVNGTYAFQDVPASTRVQVRVDAQMQKSGTPGWDVKIVDNTNGDSLYAMSGSLTTSGTSSSIRDLNAPSGWGGNSYSSTRTAAPFAILDDIYYAMHRVLSADAKTIFPALTVNWSVNNVPSTTYNYTSGQIGTSHYTNSNLYILGDADSDTDEYDNHIITHEWGHYYEDKFSRADSPGGNHYGGERLDIRLAFSEGWGNAFSAMALDDPHYFDTQDTEQAGGFNFNVESETHDTPGWYSESSIQRILYDLYDANDDTNGNDALTLGFTPIHEVLTGAQKNTPAFTSLFSFITALKNENAADTQEIDYIVSSENIATISDIYGTGRTNAAGEYPYISLTSGSSVSIHLSNQDGNFNKLSNRKYIQFTISTPGTYTIKAEQTNGTKSDPDFYLYRSSPFAFIGSSEDGTPQVAEKSFTLSRGNYLLDVTDYNNINNAQLVVSIKL